MRATVIHTEASSSPTMRDRMLADHRRLEGLFTRLLDAFDANAREDTQRLWAQLESGLERHFSVEEDLVFPRFSTVDPNETKALQAEHQTLRTQLAELGVGVELKMVRAELAHQFIETLRAHASREDRLLYRWLDQHRNESHQTIAARMVS